MPSATRPKHVSFGSTCVLREYTEFGHGRSPSAAPLSCCRLKFFAVALRSGLPGRMPDRACLRHIAGPFRPSAAEHLVQRHQVRQLRQLIRNELLLRRIERPLRGQQREETVRAGSVACLREIVVVLRRSHIVAIRFDLRYIGLAPGQCIGDFLERGSESSSRSPPRRYPSRSVQRRATPCCCRN